MKKLVKPLMAVATAVALSSCSLTLPVAATSNPVGSKVGKASGTCYLGVICLGADASIQTAAQNGGIKKISTVDIKTNNILNLIVTYETIVTGE
ncbi:MAG: hypothetical protein D6707_00130 [Bacteroidetes bacterium]|nr:MAG: hypothetical protein D6707_00130 [Bacteroidota bacterium]